MRQRWRRRGQTTDPDTHPDHVANNRSNTDANADPHFQRGTDARADSDTDANTGRIPFPDANAEHRNIADAVGVPLSDSSADRNTDANTRHRRLERRRPLGVKITMRFQSMPLRFAGAMSASCLILSGLIAAPGCGGSGGRATTVLSDTSVQSVGKASFTIHWPAPSRLIPSAANSIVVTIAKTDGSLLAKKTLSRPVEGGTTSATFDDLQVGSVVATVTAHPSTDGTGTVQASAADTVTIEGGKTATLSLTLGSTIDHLDVSPSSLPLTTGETASLTVTAKNAEGEIVLTAPANITFASDTAGTATVDSNGQITAGSTAGTATITVTEKESGKTTTATITVSPPAAIIPQKSVSYQIDASHSGGAVFGKPLQFPPQPDWSIPQSAGIITSPLIADGRVFFQDNKGLNAYNLKTGAHLWGPIPTSVYFQSVYDNGKIYLCTFDSDRNNVVLAINPATGTPLWRTKLPGSLSVYISDPLIATQGLVISSYNTGTETIVAALDQSTGAVQWTRKQSVSPAYSMVSSDGQLLFLSNGDKFTALNLPTGAQLWQQTTDGYFYQSVFGGGLVSTQKSKSFVQNPLFDVFNPTTGTIISSYGGNLSTESYLLPVFSRTMKLQIRNIPSRFIADFRYAIDSIDIVTNQKLWTVERPGTATAAIVIDDTLFITKLGKTVEAVSTSNRALLWSGDIGEASGFLKPFMAAGEGYLVINGPSKTTIWKLVGSQ
jgi:outer membrane protein assembly factor BamB